METTAPIDAEGNCPFTKDEDAIPFLEAVEERPAEPEDTLLAIIQGFLEPTGYRQ